DRSSLRRRPDPSARPRLQSRPGDLPARRIHEARHRRPGHGAAGPRLPPRRGLDRLGDDRRRRRGGGQGGRPAVRGRGARGRQLPDPADLLGSGCLQRLLQHHRQPDALVHPALPLGPEQRARHPLRGGRGLRPRLPGGQPGPRRRRARGDRGRGGAGGDGPRLSPLHAAGDDPRGAPGRLPAPLRPHPVDAVRRLARAARPPARGDLPRRPGQRHHRLPHALVPAQLPAVLPRPARARRRHGQGDRPDRRPRGVGARLSAAHRLPRHAVDEEARPRQGVRGEAAQAPARVLDPARRPRGPLQERPARLHRLRHLPRAASGVRRAHHLHRAADAVAHRRARVRGIPRAHRGAGGGGQPPPRDAGLDADRLEAARRPRRGHRLLQALRRDDGQRHVRRHEPGGQGGPAGQRARGRLDPRREHRRARGARGVRAVGEPLRRPGARRRDLLRADHADGEPGAPRQGALRDRHAPRSRQLDRRPDRRHPPEGASGGSVAL
ncbi:MAG: Alpha,alpha-trehalose-phosphate synthase [UDP-forming], partial [uncultured Solirubrobacteraceae bacterium]